MWEIVYSEEDMCLCRRELLAAMHIYLPLRTNSESDGDLGDVTGLILHRRKLTRVRRSMYSTRAVFFQLDHTRRVQCNYILMV